jgi:ATP-dependent Clp protease ATP-binding subunit ClpA
MNSDTTPVSEADVSQAVKELYNVDPAELETEKKIERYRKLQASFENLVGQEEAKESILRNTRQIFAGVVDRNKPRQRVLLAGLKGQGKTEMIRLFAESMGLPEDNRLVMSEYSTSFDVNRMKQRIAQLVRRNPFTVLFFDEIEKAHPDVQKALLGILDSATMTYSAQENTPIKISLRNASVFMATNAGSEFIMRNASSSPKVKMGFINSDSPEAAKEVSSNQFRQALVADGLNEYLLDRMSVVTPFKILTKDEFKKVLEIHFKKGIKEIEKNSKTVVEIKNLPELINSLGEKLYFPGVSNREVERIVNDELRQKVADVLFEAGGQKVLLNWDAGALQPMISCEGVFVR